MTGCMYANSAMAVMELQAAIWAGNKNTDYT